MNIYIMRHGTTVWNEKGITQGHSNNRLSQSGKIKTEQVAEENKNLKIDVIFCSPLMRTVQTANIMNKFHDAKIIKDPLLIEINQGIFTGRHKDSYSEKENEQRFKRDAACGMESYQSVVKRSKNFVENIKKTSFDNVLIITHNVNASLLEKILLNQTIDFSNPTHTRCFKNAEFKKFSIKI